MCVCVPNQQQGQITLRVSISLQWNVDKDEGGTSTGAGSESFRGRELLADCEPQNRRFGLQPPLLLSFQAVAALVHTRSSWH